MNFNYNDVPAEVNVNFLHQLERDNGILLSAEITQETLPRAQQCLGQLSGNEDPTVKYYRQQLQKLIAEYENNEDDEFEFYDEDYVVGRQTYPTSSIPDIFGVDLLKVIVEERACHEKKTAGTSTIKAEIEKLIGCTLDELTDDSFSVTVIRKVSALLKFSPQSFVPKKF